MKKSEAIIVVNNYLGYEKLNSKNTNFSKINDKKPVWWFNIPPERFLNDLHILMLKETGFIWVKIPANTFSNLDKVFRIRKDKNVVDLEISANKGHYYMRDVKSKGTGYSFEPYIEHVFEI